MARRRRVEASRSLALVSGLLLLAGALSFALWLGPTSTSDGGSPVPERVATETDGLSVQMLRARVVRVYPHDAKAWTQGLLWHDGWVYESTGLNGESSLRQVRLRDGEVELRVALEDRLFGEGLARVGQQLLQLTWRSGLGLRYELDGFAPLEAFSYSGEGWGLCFDGRSVVRSDGTPQLYFHDPDTFEVQRALNVEHLGEAVSNLNELECAKGWIYANVLNSDAILRVDPATGRVVAIVDASGLLSREEKAGANVLNGIAYYPPGESFLLTGKFWPKLFEVVFVAE